MIFNCEVTTTRDSVGVEWCEPRYYTELCATALGVFGFTISMIGGLVALVVFALVRSHVWVIFAAMTAVLFGLSYGIIWLGVRVPARQRAIYFKRNGTIESPHGLFDGTKIVGPWKTTLGDIANIEAEQIVFPKPEQIEHYTHCVRMILKSGRVFHIAGNLMPDQAHELAVSLSQAREAMRYDVSAASPRARSREAVY